MTTWSKISHETITSNPTRALGRFNDRATRPIRCRSSKVQVCPNVVNPTRGMPAPAPVEDQTRMTRYSTKREVLMAPTGRVAGGSTDAAPNDAAVGLTVFAAVMMIMLGIFQAIQGIVALFNDNFYVAGQKWVFEFDLTAWGWIHLLVGVLIAVAGFFVLQGTTWARWLGIGGRGREEG